MKSSLFCWSISAALLTTAVTSVAQTLTVTDGLVLWLRADAGVTTNENGLVMQWDDQSGSLNHASQTTDLQMPLFVPNAITNKPALRFDGSATAGEHDFLNIPHAESLAITADLTTLFVIKVDDFANYNAVWSKTAGNLPAPTDLYTDVNSGLMRVYRGNGTAENLSTVPSAQAIRAGAYLVLGVDIRETTATHYLNGQPNGTGTVNTNTADTVQDMKIGTRNDLFTKMRGDIAEILIYNRSLSEAERNSAFSYLQNKYGLQNSPPSVTLSATPSGSVNAGAIVTLNATAVDLDGSIARVEFLANGVAIGTALAPPYRLRVQTESAGNVVFTARAVDNRDVAGTSAPLTNTVTGAGPTVNPVTSGVQLWMQADTGTTLGTGDKVLEWADQSGNRNTAAQTDENLAPTLVANALNGHAVVRFDGVDDVLDVADSDSISITNDISTFYVLRFDNFSTFRSVWGKTLVNQPAPTDIYAGSGSGTPVFYRGNGTSPGNANGARPYPAGSYILAGVQQAGTAVSHFLNGAPNGGGTITVVAEDRDTALRIGSRGDGVTRMSGDLAELLIYDRALSASERTALQRHLAEKYALPGFVTAINASPTVAVAVTNVPQAPTNFTFSVDSSDPDGAVTSVQLLVNGIMYANDTNAPFSVTVDVPYGGEVVLTAIATDNFGARTTTTRTYCVPGPSWPYGLVGYWPLNGNADAAVGPDGVLINSPVAAPDRLGTANGALAFDGSRSNRVEIPGGGGLSGAQQGTISMWVNWTGTQDGGFGNSYGAVLGRQLDGVFSANIINLTAADPAIAFVQWRRGSGVSITGTTAVGNDTWHHVAVTFTTTNSELYLDGVSQGVGPAGSLTANVTTPLAIGAWTGGGGSYATAAIDDVAIWNRVLAPTEIQDLAASFAGVLALQSQPDCLTIRPAIVSGREIRWGSDGVLQHADTLDGPWADVAGATSPYTVPQGPMKFYRLRSL
jgi:hypothetical protein